MHGFLGDFGLEDVLVAQHLVFRSNGQQAILVIGQIAQADFTGGDDGGEILVFNIGRYAYTRASNSATCFHVEQTISSPFK